MNESKSVGKIEDGVVFLSCLYIANKSHKGRGLGERLLDAVVSNLKKRRFKALETFARKGSSLNPSGPDELSAHAAKYWK